MRGFDRAQREYDRREPIERCEHGVDTYQRDCSICEYERELAEAEEDDEAAVPLAIVGAVGAILLWLSLSAPASSAEAFSARGSGEAGAFLLEFSQ